jgi:hypothetical protein
MQQQWNWLPLLVGLLAGCTSHEFTQLKLDPVAAIPYSELQVQVQFDNPTHTEYLANRLAMALAEYGVTATVLPPAAKPDMVGDSAPAVLQLRLTDTWTDTVITTRHKHRRSLTQMRGRIPRESPRFTTETVLVDRPSSNTVWQLRSYTAGAWYSDFETNADSLAAKLTQQLAKQGLIERGK